MPATDHWVPTLVIHGQKDRLIDSSQGQQLFDLCPSRKKLFVCPEEMGHNDDLLSDPEFLIRPILRFFPLPDYYFTALRVPKEANFCKLSNSASLSLSLAMASRWPEVAAFLFLDCRELFHSLLEDPLDWRALQCACRWRSSSLQPLLAKVHHEPKLRVVIQDMCQKLRRFPMDDLLGDQMRNANLTDTELRFLIEILGARPRGLSAKKLDLRGCFPSLCASQGFALGLWLRRFQGECLRLAECRGLLRGLGLSELLRGLGSCQLALKHLDLCAAQLSKLEAPTLCRFLRSCQLETLNLAFNERLMSCEALEGMVDALQGGTFRLSELVLKHCNIQGKAGELLGIWLRHMPRLRELNLNWNPEIVSSRGLRGLFNSLASDELALQRVRLRGSDPDQAAQAALRDVLQRFPSLTLELDVLPEKLLATHGPSKRQQQPRPMQNSLLRLMRLPDFREQLRTFLPGPLEWRALQSSWRWSSDGSAGPLQEVHRRPRLRQSVSKLRRRLKGKPLNDLLSLLRFAIELMGARPRKAPAGKVSEIQKLDLSYEHLPPGGKAMAPQRGFALGNFLRYCSQLVELRLE
eukprot:s5109_g1.t2